jgi:hypothetical protein
MNIFKRDIFRKKEKDLQNSLEPEKLNSFGQVEGLKEILIYAKVLFIEASGISLTVPAYASVPNYCKNYIPLFMFGKNDFAQKYKITRSLFKNIANYMFIDEELEGGERSWRGLYYLSTDTKNNLIDFPAFNPFSYTTKCYFSYLLNNMAGFRLHDGYFGYYSFSENGGTVTDFGILVYFDCPDIGYLALMELFSSNLYNIEKITISSLVPAHEQIFNESFSVYRINMFGQSKLDTFALSNYIKPNQYQKIAEIDVDIKIDNEVAFYMNIPYTMATYQDGVVFKLKIRKRNGKEN